MNIVVITIDTLRYDHVRANGNPAIRTPNLDRLAGRSFAFDNAFAASFPTIPNRTDVFTGRYGAPFHPWTPLDCDVPTLPSLVGDAGYLTQLIHDTPHLVNGGHRFDYPFHAWTPVRGGEVDRAWITDSWALLDNWSFDALFDGVGYERDPEPVLRNHHALARYVHTNRGRTDHEDWNAAKLFRAGADFLSDNADRENFFLWLDCFDPHEPWDAPPEYVRMYDDTPGYDGTIDPRSFHGGVRNDPSLSEAARDRVRATYQAKVTFMDRWLGTFLDALESTGLAGNTAILLAGDHGTNLNDVPDRGFGKSAPPRANEAHVPVFLDVPGAGSGRCDAIVQPQDYFATLAELAGASVPEDHDGRDMRALAREERAESRREIAISGSSVDSWQGATHEETLFSAFDGEWSLGVAADPDACELRRLDSPEDVSADHPEVLGRLREAAANEIVRRGLDPALADWLREEGRAEFPSEFTVSSARPAPPGWETYWNKPFHR